jgi:pyruvate dehydrogenase E2 component (dihydrolipoamide acetyltransferase)
MPALGADMESGVLVEWLVEPGKQVKRGDVVAVVETQKGAVEVEIWEDGVVDQGPGRRAARNAQASRCAAVRARAPGKARR